MMLKNNDFIISRTPYRISFLGGGTDYQSWCGEHLGSVLSTAINKYCYLMVRYLPPFFEHKYLFTYREVETPSDIEEIHHPSIRETLKYLGIEEGVAIHHAGDIPARSGMGTNSAFTVGLVKALNCLKGVNINPHELAKESIFIDQELIKENVGSQDQTASAFGGFNVINFLGKEINVIPLSDEMYEFEKYIMLFFTGLSRTASKIVKDQLDRSKENEPILKEMFGLVKEGSILLGNKKFIDLGKMILYNWECKKRLSIRITTDYIDFLFNKAISAGAVGGKLLGAGGGGFLLFVVEPEKQEYVRKALSELLYVPIKFEKEGSKIIYG